ncbi:5-oxoprolinase subunit PxpA [Thalassotalea piscium]|uniref:UPF0271 protein n=1 Tax=Thalassotalea piscium TaxID=1230533 RepID=A0A7X0NKB7_9GAMM|nr:5-oxoprolinase subunit PxpA [Thalassotalea piscium]MBB6545052.1 UPF0271 protein [Thalassotalea piscium]
MKLNCDLAEIDNGVAELVMPFIDMANICCAAHAGSTALIKSTLKLAKKYQVEIGAHPSYPDRENFGRKSINISKQELTETLYQQISLVCLLAHENGQEVSYVKPHGALYNDMINDEQLFILILKVIEQINSSLKLMLLATPNNQHFRQLANAFGIELIFEAFADRRYTDDGFLMSRTVSGAVLNKEQTLAQVQQLIATQTVETSGKRLLPLNAQTVCVHGDNKDGVDLIKELKELCHQ